MSSVLLQRDFVQDFMLLSIVDYFCFRFQINLRICLLQISGYKKLFLEVEDVRKQPYDSDNPEHEQQLMEVSSRYLVL